jgi:hypothetical protein
MALTIICEEDNPDMIIHAASNIPPGLMQLYKQLYDRIQIRRRHEWKGRLATRVFSWILGVRTQLKSEELIKAVRCFHDYIDISIEDILSACNHLVILNKAQDVFEFGHFSVLEFLRKEDPNIEFNIHASLADNCLQILLDVARAKDPIEGSATELIKYVSSVQQCDNYLNATFDVRSILIYAEEFWAYHCCNSISADDQSKWENTLNKWICCVRRLKSKIRLMSPHFIGTADMISKRIGYTTERGISSFFDRHKDTYHDVWIFLVRCKCIF